MQQCPTSTAEARHILDQFLKHLKTGGVYRWGEKNDKVDGSERKEGMLGTSVGKNGISESEKGPICNGKEGKIGQPPGGICVYHGKESNWETSIHWLKQFRVALETVCATNSQIATIKRNIEKLQTLLHRAEQIYETNKVISEVQKPVVPKDFQTTAKRLTAYNAAWSHHPHNHLILLFVFL
ncbi:unnamed protein product [Trypanosoma congolense IL3000]|uniref:WGS project CAEQ00000000 data, annotated contig 1722 n=1 Tax=Trypanosoma congolense (strain IL3000) TaxID=1068625 RepID=F9W8B1_TRYCI|nr:unnamed protein product [Trypanosoma congolense IL3000]